jgi:hypothetical protein
MRKKQQHRRVCPAMKAVPVPLSAQATVPKKMNKANNIPK